MRGTGGQGQTGGHQEAFQRGTREVRGRQDVFLNAVFASTVIEFAFLIQQVPAEFRRVIPQEQTVRVCRYVLNGVRGTSDRIKRRHEASEVDAGNQRGIGLGLRLIHDLHEVRLTNKLGERLRSVLPVQCLEQQERLGLLVTGHGEAERTDDVRGAVLVLVALAPQCERELHFECWVFRRAIVFLWVLAELNVLDQTPERIALWQQSGTTAALYGLVHVIGSFRSGIRLGQQVLIAHSISFLVDEIDDVQQAGGQHSTRDGQLDLVELAGLWDDMVHAIHDQTVQGDRTGGQDCEDDADNHATFSLSFMLGPASTSTGNGTHRS